VGSVALQSPGASSEVGEGNVATKRLGGGDVRRLEKPLGIEKKGQGGVVTTYCEFGRR